MVLSMKWHRAALTAVLLACAGCTSSASPSPSAPAISSSGPELVTSGCPQFPRDSSDPASKAALGADPAAVALTHIATVSTFSGALASTGTTDIIDQLPAVTLFVPTDAAFAAYRASLGVTKYNALVADQAQLSVLLSGHVVPQILHLADLVGPLQSLSGATLTGAGSTAAPTINGHRIICGPIAVKSGEIYLVNAVLT